MDAFTFGDIDTHDKVVSCQFGCMFEYPLFCTLWGL
jgi:hypothetical protein